jgi:multiple sugar transport system substrate-binding protein
MRKRGRATFAATAVAALWLQAGIAGAAEVVWWAPNWGQARAEELAKRFEAANPGTTVRLEITVSDGLQNRILVALQSGTPPDLIDAQSGWNIPYANTGKLLALDEFVAKENIDLGDFQPVALRTATHAEKLYGIPYRIESHALIYNKKAYREAGLDPDRPPATWQELIDTAKKLTRKTADGKQQYGFAITGGGELGNTVFRSLPFLWMNGGGILSDDMTKVIVNTPQSVQAVQFYTDMLTKLGVSPPSTLQNDGTANRRLFIAGTVAQYQSGQFDLGSIHAENPDIEIGVAPIPHPDGKPTAALAGGWNWIVPAEAKNTDGALKLVAFLSEPQNMGYYTDTFPARKSAMDLPRFQAPELQGFKAMLQFARQPPPHPNWIQITQLYFNHVQEILLGEATPQEAMDAAAEEIEPLLQQ